MTAATDAATEAVEEIVATDAGKAVAVALGIAAGCVAVAWAVRRIGEAADVATEPIRRSMWETPIPPYAVADVDDEDQGDDVYEGDGYAEEDGASDGGFVR